MRGRFGRQLPHSLADRRFRGPQNVGSNHSTHPSWKLRVCRMGDTAFARPLMPRAARKRTATPPKRTPRAHDARSAPRPRAGGGEHPAPRAETPRGRHRVCPAPHARNTVPARRGARRAPPTRRNAPRPRAGGGEHPATGEENPRPARIRIKGLWGSSARTKHTEFSKPRAPARAARAPAARGNGGALVCAAAWGRARARPCSGASPRRAENS